MELEVDIVEQVEREGLSLDDLNKYLEDMRFQPAWRGRSDEEADYYDDNQYDAETLAALAEKGLPPIVINMIKPSINAVLGLEAKTRTDWVVRAESQASELAEALTAELKTAENMTRANRAAADAYADQVKVGLGWVEVSRNANPFEYALRVAPVNRREIWWDWLARAPDLSDARYLVRRKWYDADHAAALWPAQGELIRRAGDATALWDPAKWAEAPYLAQDSLRAREWGWDEAEWRDTSRRRVCLYEVWYRTWQRVPVLRLPDSRVVEVDLANPAHQLALANGVGELTRATVAKMRRSWWMGPYRFADGPSPYRHSEFPYIPFWGYREDRTGVPYGLIRSMRPMQDEVNARRAKMLWQLSATRVLADDDAVADHQMAQAEVSRPDAYLQLNAARRNANGFRIDEHQGLNQQQFQVYEDAKHTIQDVSGVYQQLLGKEGAATSGVAIQSLVEQSTTTLAEINDNYRYARQKLGEHLLSFVTGELQHKRNHAVHVDRQTGGRRKTVVLNQPMRDEATGQRYLNNDVTRERMRVELDRVPATATYRQQVATQMAELTKSLPEQLQMALVDMVVEASDMPNKDAIAERIRKVTGQADPGDPQNAEAMQQKAAMQAQAAALQHQGQEAEIRAKLAAAMKDEADAKATLAKIEQIAAEIAATHAKTENTAAETAETEAETHEKYGYDPNLVDTSGQGVVPGVAGQDSQAA